MAVPICLGFECQVFPIQLNVLVTSGCVDLNLDEFFWSGVHVGRVMVLRELLCGENVYSFLYM